MAKPRARRSAPPPKPIKQVRRKARAQFGKKLDLIDYKDTDLLRAFMSERGKIRARRVTGVTPKQQRELTLAIKNAREMALLPYATAGR
jgi:small subunit ribosomal protein S18